MVYDEHKQLIMLLVVKMHQIKAREASWWLAVLHSSSIVHRMNEVTLHWARLVLGWVTIFRQVYHIQAN